MLCSGERVAGPPVIGLRGRPLVNYEVAGPYQASESRDGLAVSNEAPARGPLADCRCRDQARRMNHTMATTTNVKTTVPIPMYI